MPRRVPANIQEADLDTLGALESLADFDPRNKGFSTESARAARDAMVATQSRLAQLERDIAATRDAAARDENAFHDIIIGARNEVAVQYGPDSDAVQAVGRKKASDRRPPTPRRRVSAPDAP